MIYAFLDYIDEHGLSNQPFISNFEFANLQKTCLYVLSYSIALTLLLSGFLWRYQSSLSIGMSFPHTQTFRYPLTVILLVSRLMIIFPLSLHYS